MESIKSCQITDANDLMQMLRDYGTIPGAIPGFKFLIARRLLTVSMEDDGLENTVCFMEQIRSQGFLIPRLLRKLGDWVENVPASNTFTILSVTEERFRKILNAEILRLEAVVPEMIRSTVRSCYQWTPLVDYLKIVCVSFQIVTNQILLPMDAFS